MIRLLLWEGAPLAPMAHRWERTIVRKVNTSYVLFVFFYLKCVERKGFSPFLSYDV